MPAPKNNTIEDKTQVSLIPLDLIIPMLEPAYREGILKYQRESWRLGFNSTVMYDALMRHLIAWFFKLESCDPEAKERFNINKHHLGAAMFCLINLYDTEMNHSELDDRPLKILKKGRDRIKYSSAFAMALKKEFFNQDSIKTVTLKELIGRTLKITVSFDAISFDTNSFTKVYFAQDIKSNELFMLSEEL